MDGWRTTIYILDLRKALFVIKRNFRNAMTSAQQMSDENVTNTIVIVASSSYLYKKIFVSRIEAQQTRRKTHSSASKCHERVSPHFDSSLQRYRSSTTVIIEPY